MIEKELHLRDYINIINKRRRSFYVFFIVTMVLVVIGVFTVTPKYKATTRLLIEKVEPYTIADYRLTPYDPDFYSTQYALIKSRPVAEKVVENLLKTTVYASFIRKEFPIERKGIVSMIKGLFTDKQAVTEEDWRSEVADLLAKDITVSPVRDTRLVNVTYLSSNADFAATVANAMARGYIEALLEMRIQISRTSLKWMSSQVDQEKASLERAEKALQEYMQANNIVTIEDRVTVLPQKMGELGTQLTKAQTKRKELESLVAKIKTLPSDYSGAETIPVIASDSTVSDLRSKIIKSEQNIQELSKKFGPKHPAMKEAHEELRVLREKHIQQIKRVIRSITTDFELAKDNEKDISKLLSATQQEAQNLNEKFIQYSVLKRDVDTKRQLFDSLLKRMGEQNINEEVQSVNVVHLEPAKMPKAPDRPRKLLNIMLGLIFGCFGGFGLVFFMEYFDNTLKSPDDVEQKLGVPVLGMIGFLKHDDAAHDFQEIETIVQTDPKSPYSENYKALRTAIMLSSADSPPNKLLVTSMGPEEGKTATSVNLATVIAQMDKKVLLIDCDLRKPRIHKIFKMENNAGVSTFVAGSSTKIVRQSRIPNLYVITSGPIPPNPSEMLGSARFDELLASVLDKFDMVICDSPPLLSVTDSLILSRKIGNVMVVARAGKATFEMVAKGLKAINEIKARAIGILLNAVDFSKGGYYYYYRYHNYDYYSYQEESEDKS